MVEAVLEAIQKARADSVLFIGDTDTGKTTLWRKTAEALLREGLRVGLVDTDIGQASLFLPATVSAKVVSSEEALRQRQVEFIYFVGLWNPALSPETHLRASSKAFEFAKDRAEIVLVDTTGLVKGRYGVSLKLDKIRQLAPSLVVAIQKEKELEPILSRVPEERVLTLRPSPEVKPRPRTQRIAYRRGLYREYFRQLHLHELPHERVRFLFSFTPRNQRGLLSGLQSGGRTIGLGVIEDYKGGQIEFLTPVTLENRIERALVGGVFLEEEIYL